MANKIDKIRVLEQNPSASHEYIQVLRSKINEIISVLNKEDVVSSKSADEQIGELKARLAVAVKDEKYAEAAQLSQLLKGLENQANGKN